MKPTFYFNKLFSWVDHGDSGITATLIGVQNEGGKYSIITTSRIVRIEYTNGNVNAIETSDSIYRRNPSVV